MKAYWYTHKPPFVGAKWEKTKLTTWWKSPAIKISYECPMRDTTSVALIIEFDSLEERKWMFDRICKKFNYKSYEKGLVQKIQEIRKEYNK